VPELRDAQLHLLRALQVWPELMRERASKPAKFLLQLPGGLGPLDTPELVCCSLSISNLRRNVQFAMGAKERGNAAYRAGDYAIALREYLDGLQVGSAGCGSAWFACQMCCCCCCC
jgi:hypothetical protein